MTELLFAAVALAAIVFSHLQTREARRQLDHSLRIAAARESGFAAERRTWARERNELNNRIQAPEVTRVAPPPAPPIDDVDALLAAAGVTVDAQTNDDEPDESHLIGTVLGLGADDEATPA